MLELKFRFWIQDAKKMASWEDAIKNCDRLSLLNMPGWIALQYTGLKDNNGKEICQGDILGYKNKRYAITLIKAVVWNKNKCGFNIRCTLNNKDVFREILGNIYENPELLNGLSGKD